ncbi:hypothetical protein F367_017 [Campylobacter phage F367]|uniref:Uncharacterized protein n=1 Tax=Campylobacter phage F367 TaxID=2794371 RepID=A0A7T3KG46_9CAUD|nr:hypothetical protein F367_017 [Campylobacter phage F367]QQV87870.1 hypothetical protein [Campylobacter phage CJLB-7]
MMNSLKSTMIKKGIYSKLIFYDFMCLVIFSISEFLNTLIFIKERK